MVVFTAEGPRSIDDRAQVMAAWRAYDGPTPWEE
jgi:hypothetical protein